VKVHRVLNGTLHVVDIGVCGGHWGPPFVASATVRPPQSMGYSRVLSQSSGLPVAKEPFNGLPDLQSSARGSA
jgi:hypothetical protein